MMLAVRMTPIGRASSQWNPCDVTLPSRLKRFLEGQHHRGLGSKSPSLHAAT